MISLNKSRYLLSGVVSRVRNPLHVEIAGRICTLDRLYENELGWFSVEMEDGMHTIRTTPVREMEYPDADTIVVHTANSVYTFVLVTGIPAETFKEEEVVARGG